ncbi:MAG: signal peptidase I [Candidatus Cloacimonetes bacterium]|nr:signal peptidase I [Candidatus Cloacimonadota bacterium]
MFRKKIKKIKRKKNIIQEYVEAILFAFVVAFIIKNYVFQNFKIPSSSMESTMLIGDYLYGDRLKYYFSEPQREDIVIFQYPADPPEPGLPTVENPQPAISRDNYLLLIKPVYWDKYNKKIIWHQKKNVVKRVIGMPGDTIQIVNKKVFINGVPFIRDYEQHIDRVNIPYDKGNLYWNGEFMGSRDNFGPVVVPDAKYFVMGDNRDVSADSRYWGFLDRYDITGRPLFIFFSYGEPPIKSYTELLYRQRGLIAPAGRIRWERMLHFY